MAVRAREPREVGPPGLEPGTCGLRVCSGSTGQRIASRLSYGFASQFYPSFPNTSRYLTERRRDETGPQRCYLIAQRSDSCVTGGCGRRP